MKKTFLLKTLLLLCVFIVGGASSVWAEKITNYNNIISGTQYYIGATTGGTDYYLSVDGSSPSNSIAGTAVTTKQNATVFTFEGSGTSWTIQFESGNYLSLKNSKDNGKVQVVESAATFTTSNQSSKIRLTIGDYSIQKNNSGTQFGSYGNTQTDLWLEPAVVAPSHSITAQSNNISYGTVALEGNVITATPEDGYRVSTSNPYTVSPENSATVAQNGNAFTVTPTANTTVTINFEAIPTHIATFSVNGVTSTQVFGEGAAISFPSDPASIAGKAFVGWVTAAIDGTIDEAPDFVTSAAMGLSDVTYYAVFATTGVGAPEETKTQTLQYDTWSYSGTTTDKTSYRLFGNDSYIESAAFDLSKLSKVIVYGGTFGGDSYNSLTIGDGTNIWKTVTVSGSSQTGENEYTDGEALTGTNKLRITATAGNGTNTGLRFSKIEIYTIEPSISYSEYRTSVVVTAVETPVFSPVGGAVASGTEVTITCSTEGASIHYTTDGTDPSSNSTTYDPSNKPIITSNTTFKAIAVKDGLNNSEVASASYTVALPCATPTFSLGEGEYAKGTTVTISSETSDATIYYTTNGDIPTTNSQVYNTGITINSDMTIKAIAVKDGWLNSEVVSVSYTVIDYATLPLVWNGGSSSSLTALSGVTANGLGSDYAESNAPYRVKMDNANDYIQIKTNAQPVKVLVGVKMLGGNKTSKIKIQESADGSSFSDVEELEISGDQNNILNLKSSNSFAATTRYVKIIKSVHGSNIGVGPIMVLDFNDIPVTLNASGYATFASTYPLDFSDDSDFSAWQITEISGNAITFSQITGTVAAGTGVLLKGTPSTTINIPVATSGSDISATNKLFGTAAPTPIEANTHFGLSGNKFVKVNAGTVPAGKALIPASAIPAHARDLSFVFEGETTGISSLTSVLSEGEGAVYNLNGQRVEKPLKGLFIKNGKKMMIK